MRYLYLHGFASSPRSRKAVAFRDALRARGIALEIPSLDAADFEHLTITGQLDLITRLLGNAPARLIGSSMGGYLGALYASLHPEADRLVLLAPAFGFMSHWQAVTGARQFAAWRDTGSFSFYHHGEQAVRKLHFGLVEDALRYPENPSFTQPALVFHGTQDVVVPAAYSRAFASAHPNVILREMDSGHELLSVLDAIVNSAVPFLTAATASGLQGRG